MTTMNFEDAVSELVNVINALSPQDKVLAMQELRCAIAANDGTHLQLVSPSDEENLFDKVPV